MPILIECSNCKRKLRVQDHLLGKLVKCPSCQVKFLAQLAESQPALAVSEAVPPSPSPSPSVGEDSMRTPLLAPENAPVAEPLGAALEVTDPASSPSTTPARPRSAEGITAAPIATPPKSLEVEPAVAEALPQLFSTPLPRVLAVIAAVVLFAAIVGCGVGWWLGAAVESAASSAAGKSP